MTEPYKIATEFGIEKAKQEVEVIAPGEHLTEAGELLLAKAAYWSAWRAARNVAAQMLDKAENLGLRVEDMAELQKVAEEWAFD